MARGEDYAQYPNGKKILANIGFDLEGMTASVSAVGAVDRKDYAGAMGSTISLYGTSGKRFTTERLEKVNAKLLAMALSAERIDSAGVLNAAYQAASDAAGMNWRASRIEFSGISWGAGSNYIIRTVEDNFIVSVLRDPKAPIFARMLGGLSGVGDNDDPVNTAFSETSEEVLVFSDAHISLIPRLDGKYSGYNKVIYGHIRAMAKEFGFSTKVTSAPISSFRDSFLVNSSPAPVRLALCYRTLNEMEGMPLWDIEIVAPPMVIDLGDYNIGDLAPRETIEIETGGMVGERPVVLIGLSTGRFKLFVKGELEGAFGSFEEFADSGVDIDRKVSMIPMLASAIEGLYIPLRRSIKKFVDDAAIPFRDQRNFRAI
jgi:hypothetical protein